MQQKSYTQAFYVKDKKIILDDLPIELYNSVNEQIPEFYSKIDERAWISTVEKDDIKYYVVLSRKKEAVQEFMNTVLFAEQILN
jgi:hypothetical protein